MREKSLKCTSECVNIIISELYLHKAAKEKTHFKQTLELCDLRIKISQLQASVSSSVKWVNNPNTSLHGNQGESDWDPAHSRCSPRRRFLPESDRSLGSSRQKA